MKQKTFFWTTTVLILFILYSCRKDFSKYENLEIVEDTFQGNMMLESDGEEPDGDFTGNNSSGVFSFAWFNPEKKASANFDVTTTGGGTVQLIIQDARGKEVLNKTRPQGDKDTYSGVTEKGTSGTWLITFVFDNLNGDGSFSIHPGD